MKFTSPVYSAVSGSIAGLTYARNAGGMYSRARATVTNPNTAAQIEVRQNLAGLTAAWALDLDDPQQAGWKTYGANVPVTNALGNAVHRSGQNWFIGCNTIRKQAGLDELLTAPSDFTRATGTTPVPTITANGTTVSVAFTASDSWATVDEGVLLVFASRPQNSGRSFFKGPFKLSGVVLGDTTTPPTSPAVITLPFASAASGTKQFFRFVYLNADGRYSDGVIVTAVVP